MYHTVLLAISYFRYFFLLSTNEYVPHTVLDWKVSDPQATTSSYQFNFGTKRKKLLFQILVQRQDGWGVDQVWAIKETSASRDREKCVCRRRLQEEAFTFGVISAWFDIHNKKGLQPSRQSASTQVGAACYFLLISTTSTTSTATPSPENINWTTKLIALDYYF